MEDDCHTTSSPQSSSNDNDDDNNPDLDLDLDLPPDFEFTCADCPQSMPDDYYLSYIPFSMADVCYVMHLEPGMCNVQITLPDITLAGQSINNNIVDSYCGNISGLACLAMLTQDIATLIDLVGVGLIETPAVIGGCFEGGPAGCILAEGAVIPVWTSTLNNAETSFSSASMGLTILDDVFNNGGWGENSSTSVATWAVGLLPLTPSWDLAVDGYSSGYNHGIFNGVYTIWSEGLMK
jgi:hypothetical protein